jgi:putative DNA primase/helicase
MIRLATETPTGEASRSSRGSSWSPYPIEGRPRIDIGERDLTRWCKDSWEAIGRVNDPPWLFKWAGQVSELVDDEPHRIGADRLRLILANEVDFGRFKDRGWRPELPPEPLVAALLADPTPPVPILNAIYPYPVVVPPGRLLLPAGYDRETGIYRLSDPQLDGLVIPVDPSPEQIQAARQLLVDELLGSVDLASDSDHAAALAFQLTFFLRPMLPGAAPGFLFQANERGSGKTRLLGSLASIALGGPPALSKVPGTDDELEKRFVGWLRSGTPLIALDNVTGHFKSDTIAAYLTSPVFQGRSLGSNTNPSFAPTAILALTGNNCSFDEDLTRRFVPINLDPRVERPADRPLASFRHILPSWAIEHRATLVEAFLTVIVAAIRANRPYSGPVLASFEEWSRLIGRVLDFLEMPGFLADRRDFEGGANPDAVPWRLLIDLWAERYREQPVSTSQVYELLDKVEDFPLLAGPDDKRKASLGKRIRDRRGRIFGSWRIVALGLGRTNTATWRLESVTRPGAPGQGDDCHLPAETLPTAETVPCPGCGGGTEPIHIDPLLLGYPQGSRLWHYGNHRCGRIVYHPAGDTR